MTLVWVLSDIVTSGERDYDESMLMIQPLSQSELSRLKVDNPNSLDHLLQSLHKLQMRRILFQIVLPVLLILELGDEHMRDAALSGWNELGSADKSSEIDMIIADYLDSLDTCVTSAGRGLNVLLLGSRMDAIVL